MARNNGRAHNELRKVKITKDFIHYPAGSVLIEMGRTKVICTASVEEKVPPFLRNKNTGWITAEYAMIPGATHSRTERESARGRQTGRSQEIQRLIGRSLRSVVEMGKLGERTVWIDCDVIQADAGTRCAAITGAYVALVLALKSLREKKLIQTIPVTGYLAATSVGIVNGEKVLDLDYEEDSQASVDLNVVRTSAGKYVEIQGTAEKEPFDDKDLASLLALADKGIKQLIAHQKKAIGKL